MTSGHLLEFCERVVLSLSISIGLVTCKAVSAELQASLLHSVCTELDPSRYLISVGHHPTFCLLPNTTKYIGLTLTLLCQEALLMTEL